MSLLVIMQECGALGKTHFIDFNFWQTMNRTPQTSLSHPLKSIFASWSIGHWTKHHRNQASDGSWGCWLDRWHQEKASGRGITNGWWIKGVRSRTWKPELQNQMKPTGYTSKSQNVKMKASLRAMWLQAQLVVQHLKPETLEHSV